MKLCFVIVFLFAEIYCTDDNISKIISKYFTSDVFSKMENEWEKYRVSYERNIEKALESGVGHPAMNVFVRHVKDPFFVTKSFYTTDGVVNLLFLNMKIKEAPQLFNPKVTMLLASNVLYLKSKIGRIIIESNYNMFRNHSDILYQGENQDLNKSPFSYQQVQDSGEIAVVAENCFLEGIVITSIGGNSVNLGYETTLKLTKCEFNIEITNPGLGLPPVFAPYFANDNQRMELERLLSISLREELIPKLQGTVYSVVNISSIFDEELLQSIVREQETAFRDTADYIDRIIGNTNKLSAAKSKSSAELEPMDVAWNVVYEGEPIKASFHVRDIVVDGLDSLHSAHVGGPYKLQCQSIGEALRFNKLIVRGKAVLKHLELSSDFVVEIRDTIVNIGIDLDAKSKKGFRTTSFKPPKTYSYMEVAGWRSLDFSMSKLYIQPMLRIQIRGLIQGYITNELPYCLINYLSKFLPEGMTKRKDGHENSPDEDLKQDHDKQQSNENFNDKTFLFSEGSPNVQIKKLNAENQSNIKMFDIDTEENDRGFNGGKSKLYEDDLIDKNLNKEELNISEETSEIKQQEALFQNLEKDAEGVIDKSINNEGRFVSEGNIFDGTNDNNDKEGNSETHDDDGVNDTINIESQIENLELNNNNQKESENEEHDEEKVMLMNDASTEEETLSRKSNVNGTVDRKIEKNSINFKGNLTGEHTSDNEILR